MCMYVCMWLRVSMYMHMHTFEGTYIHVVHMYYVYTVCLMHCSMYVCEGCMIIVCEVHVCVVHVHIYTTYMKLHITSYMCVWGSMMFNSLNNVLMSHTWTYVCESDCVNHFGGLVYSYVDEFWVFFNNH